MNLAIEGTVWRLDRRLRRDVPFSARRAIRRDVRANLRAAAQEMGEEEALRRFGDVTAVAEEYRAAAARPDAVRFDRGLIAAGYTLLALLLLAVVRVPTFGMVTTFDAFTNEQEWHLQLWRLGEFSGDIATRTLFEATVYSYSLVLFPLLAFLVWSRAWRLARTQRHARPSKPNISGLD
jgi:hypothetical protein